MNNEYPLQNLMRPKSDTEVAEVMFRTNPRKYWIQYVNALEDEIESLEEQLTEKDAMIDWLAGELFDRDRDYTAEYPSYWIKAAQEAVKKKA